MGELTVDIYGVIERKGQPMVSSRKVAEIFSKDHDNVLRDIRNLDCSEEFFLLNFEEKHYQSKRAKQPEFLMTKDGFTFLAMGYRGKKAAQFKEAYICRFNEMETFIKNLYEAKIDFPEFTDAIMAAHDECKPYHFSNECNMINAIVTGMTAKQFREAHGLDKVSSIRPYLNSEQIEMVRTLQRIDIGLIVAVPDYQERKKILEQQYRRLKAKRLTA